MPRSARLRRHIPWLVITYSSVVSQLKDYEDYINASYFLVSPSQQHHTVIFGRGIDNNSSMWT